MGGVDWETYLCAYEKIQRCPGTANLRAFLAANWFCLYLAHQRIKGPQICRFSFFPKTWFFFSIKNVFSQNICLFSFTRDFISSHLVSWHLMIRSLRWLKPIDTSLGSIILSTLHVDYTSTSLALAGISHKKGPDALGIFRTTLSVINMESLE